MNIYQMKLHETLDDLGLYSILRVPGGWIYLDKSSNISVFVPFNNEFMDTYKSSSVGI